MYTKFVSFNPKCFTSQKERESDCGYEVRHNIALVTKDQSLSAAVEEQFELSTIKNMANKQLESETIKLVNNKQSEALTTKMANKRSCTMCLKSFPNATRMTRHLLSHSGEKSHMCFQCNKSFGQAAILKRHLLVHCGEKLHKCAQCDKSFAQAKGSLSPRIRMNFRKISERGGGSFPI